MTTRPKVSIVIPNYNEEQNIKRGVLDQVVEYLSQAKFTYEVIISDDGSTDSSRDLSAAFAQKHPHFRVLNNPHGGKAAAVYAGIKAAKGEIVLFTDMDQSTPLKEIEKLLPWYDKNYHVVFGSRGKSRKNFPWYRQLTSWGFRLIRQLFLLRGVTDTQCGFKSFTTSAAQKLFPKLEIIKKAGQTKGWVVSAFDVELLFLAQKFNYRLKEIDVDWQDEDIATNKSKNFIKESLDMFRQIFRVKLNDLKGIYQ